MPAEWARHEATWLSWPHNPDTWPGCLDAVEAPMLDLVAALAEVETVHINVLDADRARYLAGRLAPRVPRGSVELHEIPTNDAWCRDHGAIFVLAGDGADEPMLAHDFGYNAWGGKYPPYDLDQEVAGRMAEVLGVPRVAHSMILEGGSIDVDGAGTLLTTEQCLLNSNRNPGLSRETIESCLREAFGVDQIVWLGAGIEGDDTDGHIDEITRFTAPRTVVTAVEQNRDDPNFEPLAANRRLLEDLRLDGGAPLEILDLPMPEPLHYRGERLPASYANFYVANETVLIPTFGVAADAAARAVLTDCFPGRRVVAIDCRHLVVGLGGLHCLTQQIPARGVGLS
ncbi:MAG TPA: agmatine deiminase family protein [Gammaproteobacteria bacterium]|nr:agmatine deiminase family protein [Gammaproteobacteria bacterium]